MTPDDDADELARILAELDRPHPDPEVAADLERLDAVRLPHVDRPVADGVAERTTRRVILDADGLPAGLHVHTTTVVTRPPDPAP